MKIYKVSQSENTDYDSYDSFVCYANTKEEAMKMHPSGSPTTRWDENLQKQVLCKWDDPKLFWNDWATSEDNVEVQHIGETFTNETEPGVILASFNAG